MFPLQWRGQRKGGLGREERVCNYDPPSSTTTTTSDSSSHPRALFKMTILIDSLRPNYDLSAVGMRWMKSRCNSGGIGLRPCWRSRRRTEWCGFSFRTHAHTQVTCVCICLVGLLRVFFFFFSNTDTSKRPLEQTVELLFRWFSVSFLYYN